MQNPSDSKPLRLAINSLSVIPGEVGGGETYLANLVGAMAGELRDGERIDLLVTRRNEGLFSVEHPRIRKVVLPVPQRRRSVRLLAEHFVLPVVLRGLDADVLFSPGNAVPVLAGVRHVLALQSMHYRFVADQMAPARVAYFRTMVPVSARRSARILCMSADLRRHLLEIVPAVRARTSVVYEGADLDALSPDGERAAGEYVLYVSSLNPFKRPDSVVRAYARLRDLGFEPPPLRMAGRDDAADRERLTGLITETKTGDLVSILGVVPHGELPALYRGAIALVYPSAVETFGLPPLEAMACDCPVVASNRTSVPEITGDAALTVDPDDIDALAVAIRRVVTDKALRKDLVARGRKNLGRFAWSRAARETLDACREARR
jgi:glycosyltransferase involved in cell wall biosynthesis